MFAERTAVDVVTKYVVCIRTTNMLFKAKTPTSSVDWLRMETRVLPDTIRIPRSRR